MPFTVTFRSLLNQSAKLLCDIGIDTARLDAEILLAHVLKKSRLDLLLDGKKKIDLKDYYHFVELLKRRLRFEPIAYVVGEKEFYGFSFFVDQHCLIPRPDTEVLVEQCLKILDRHHYDHFVELCTGSGAIAISIILQRPNLTAIASDICDKALLVAKHNAKKLGVSRKIEFRHGDLFMPFDGKDRVGLIVANPPYIKGDEIVNLSSSVRNFEPHIALDGGDGLAFYRRIISLAPRYLQPQGFLVLEIGSEQASDIEKLVGSDWQMHVFKDLGFRDRCVVLQLNARNNL